MDESINTQSSSIIFIKLLPKIPYLRIIRGVKSIDFFHFLLVQLALRPFSSVSSCSRTFLMNFHQFFIQTWGIFHSLLFLAVRFKCTKNQYKLYSNKQINFVVIFILISVYVSKWNIYFLFIRWKQIEFCCWFEIGWGWKRSNSGSVVKDCHWFTGRLKESFSFKQFW